MNEHASVDMPRHRKKQQTKLLSERPYDVKVCGFVFRFGDPQHIQKVLDFYRNKTHPSSRGPNPDWVSELAREDPVGYRDSITKIMRSHHDEMQRWWERLPLYLQENNKRERVIKALERAQRKFLPDQETKASPAVATRGASPRKKTARPVRANRRRPS